MSLFIIWENCWEIQFLEEFKLIITRYKKMGYNTEVVRQTTCSVLIQS